MDKGSIDRKPCDGGIAASAGEQRTRHSSHRTAQVKIRGLVTFPSGDDRRVEVCVNSQADWELIYKNPAIRVKCLVDSCDTLLTAKRMSRSGLRFLAVRSGGCSHNLVEMSIGSDEVEQDPSKLIGGGGPEGDEHLWVKGRLFRIARRIGTEAVVEHSLTRADVFLPDHNLVLEYQRWDTNFMARTAQRSSAGAARTIWMFPWQPPDAPKTRALRAFNDEVFEHGGIYVAVRNKDNRRELQRPWEASGQERTARLYASGSIAAYDPSREALARRERSLARILAEIISGERVLVRTHVMTKSTGRMGRARVWVLREDVARATAARKPVRHITKPAPATATTTVTRTEHLTPPENPPIAKDACTDDPRPHVHSRVPSAWPEIADASETRLEEPPAEPLEPDSANLGAKREWG